MYRHTSDTRVHSPHLGDEAVELLLGLEPLDFLVDPLVFLQLLQISPATVEIRTEAGKESVNGQASWSADEGKLRPGGHAWARELRRPVRRGLRYHFSQQLEKEQLLTSP